MPPSAAPLLPVFLKVGGRPVLLVGGGTVAVAKHAALVAAGARVRVVAPQVDPALRVSGTSIFEREFVDEDMADVWFAVAAASPEVNRQVVAAAEARRVFVNAADDPESATAYAGGVVRRGEITIAVSTSGGAPALAGLLREGLDAMLPEEDLAAWLQTAQDLRLDQRKGGVPMSARRPALLEALNRIYGHKLP